MANRISLPLWLQEFNSVKFIAVDPTKVEVFYQTEEDFYIPINMAKDRVQKPFFYKKEFGNLGQNIRRTMKFC